MVVCEFQVAREVRADVRRPIPVARMLAVLVGWPVLAWFEEYR